MFYTENLNLDIIKNRACDQLLDGTFPSFSGSPDYDDFISQVIKEEANLILGFSEIVELENIYDYKMKALEFLTDLLEILETSFTNAHRTIQEFIKQEDPDEAITRVGRIRRARKFWKVLHSPWFKITIESNQYQELLEKLRIIGQL